MEGTMNGEAVLSSSVANIKSKPSTDTNTINEILPILSIKGDKQKLLKVAITTLQKDVTDTIKKLKKLNDNCETAAAGDPINSLQRELNAVKQSVLTDPVVKSTFSKNRLGDMKWLNASKHNDYCNDLIKSASKKIDSKLDSIEGIWKAHNKQTDRRNHYTAIWNALGSIRHLANCLPNKGTFLQDKDELMHKHFERLRDLTLKHGDAVISLLKEKEGHVLVDDKEKYDRFLKVFQPLGALNHCFNDAGSGMEGITEKKKECVDKFIKDLTELSNKWVKEFEDTSSTKVLSYRLLTLQMLSEQTNVNVNDLVTEMLTAIGGGKGIPTWQTTMTAVEHEFTDIKRDSNLDTLINALRQNHETFFGKVLTIDRNDKTGKVNINHVLDYLEKGKTGLEEEENTDSEYDDPEKKYNVKPSSTPIARDLLEALYERFKEGWTATYQEGSDHAERTAKELESSLKSGSKKAVKGMIISLCEKLFALWSLVKTKAHSGSSSKPVLDNSTVKPHEVQVVGVFRMLGFGDEDDRGKEINSFMKEEFDVRKVKNHLLEVLTGEGKSIVIAIVAAVLAIIGNDVHCMCYSKYLCERDRQEFESLFNLLGIHNIRWNTYENHCEKLLSGSTSMRERIKSAILKPDEQDKPSKGKKKVVGKAGKDAVSAGGLRIAVIDETDTLWNFDTYKKEYVALAVLSLDSLKAVTDLIWKLHKDEKSLFDLQLEVFNSPELEKCIKECVEKFADLGDEEGEKGARWRTLLLGCVRNMVGDLLSYKTVRYTLNDSEELCCEEHHGVSVAMRHSYKTMWHAYRYFEKGTMKEENRNKYIELNIIGAKLAYAKIYEKYDLVLALTGTLSAMHECERAHINKELSKATGSLHMTYMPSSFVKPKRKVVEYQVTTSKKEHHKAIIACIQKHSDEQRPICLLFKNNSDITLFCASAEYEELKKQSSTQYEENFLNSNSSEVDGQISKITKLGTLTMMTEPFARGIDPKVADKKVRQLGVLLIQTFVSRTKADSDQAKGRVGRQDDNGSYALIIDTSLFKDDKDAYFKLSNEEVAALEATIGITDDKKRKDEVIRIIGKIRSEHHEAAFVQAMEEVKKTCDNHENGQQFITQLKAIDKGDNRKKVLDYIQAMNKCTVTPKKQGTGKDDVFRLVMCIDATGSMLEPIKAVTEAIGQVVNVTKTVLDYQGIEKGYEMNIVAYRNYDQGFDTLIEYTGFKGPDEYQELQKFLKGIKLIECNKNIRQLRGGGEAVEAALAYSGSLSCNAVMITGDAPPMEKEAVRALRNEKGEAYWSKVKKGNEDLSWIHNPTHYTEQIVNFKENDIPIHTNCLESEYVPPHDAFREMSSKTGGTCLENKVAGSTGSSAQQIRPLAEQMAKTIAKRVLDGVGADDFVTVGQAANGVGYV
eukprot:TRINITY_DN337_c0_g1_i5.p1 TRINITY_DN337_c0_g1~~TRINITY_DN337_c0_g1_i5.p1  ORF type:complete len:1398 (+),score=362.20 TRINITY_DN337_c0_g1_i5:50-4243(+)